MVGPLPSKQQTRVQFPFPAPSHLLANPACRNTRGLCVKKSRSTFREARMPKTETKASTVKKQSPDTELYEKQVILQYLVANDKLSERTLMARAGFDYDVEAKNRLAEAQDKKRLAHILQSPYKEKE